MKRVINDINQWPALTLLVMERWKKRPRPFTVTLTGAPKTAEQLGYLHAEVLPKLAYALWDAGEIATNSELAAKYYLKMLIGYGSYYKFTIQPRNEFGQFMPKEVVFDPDSFQRATIETLNQAIDCAIDEAAKRGVTILPPRGKDA